MLAVIGALAVVTGASGQRYKLTTGPEGPETQILDLIELTSDAVKKTGLLEEFAQKYPKHLSSGWVNEQLQNTYLATRQWDKAIVAGERILANHPDDLEAAQFNLQAAESKKDKVLTKLWQDYVVRVAERIKTAPAPKDPEALESWKIRIATAAQYTSQEEYSLYKRAVDATDPALKLKYLDDLMRQYPSTQYMPQALLLYFQMYRVIGDTPRAVHYAEHVLRGDPRNEDALLLVAQSVPDKALAYAARVIEVMQSKSKPAGVSDEEWNRKKNTYIGNAHWMQGNIHLTANRFSQADQSLRAALAYLKNNEQSAAPILFYLGWANYKLDNFADAAKFYKACMVFKGRYNDQAAKNIDVLRREHGIKD